MHGRTLAFRFNPSELERQTSAGGPRPPSVGPGNRGPAPAAGLVEGQRGELDARRAAASSLRTRLRRRPPGALDRRTSRRGAPLRRPRRDAEPHHRSVVARALGNGTDPHSPEHAAQMPVPAGRRRARAPVRRASLAQAAPPSPPSLRRCSTSPPQRLSTHSAVPSRRPSTDASSILTPSPRWPDGACREAAPCVTCSPSIVPSSR